MINQHTMSGESTMELDFFSINKQTTTTAVAAATTHHLKPTMTKKFFERRRSFRDIQSVISKINPEVVKAVIDSAAIAPKPPIITTVSSSSSSSLPCTPRKWKHQNFIIPPLPLYSPTYSYRPIHDCENGGEIETAPLTIFYNGTVAVFDAVPRDKAEYILKLAGEERFTSVQSNMAMKVGIAPNELVENFKGNLPLARRRSLERFLEKRKERLNMVSPYANCCIKKGAEVPPPANVFVPVTTDVYD